MLDQSAAALQQCTLPEKVFPLQTMILFVVNGHNTNPWLGKQGEQSPLIRNNEHSLTTSCCFPGRLPRRMQMRMVHAQGCCLGRAPT